MGFHLPQRRNTIATGMPEGFSLPEHTDYEGPVEVEVNESCFDGKERNKHARQRLRVGRGTAGKMAVVGLEDRATGHAAAKVVKYTDRETCRASLVVMYSWYPSTPTRPVSTTPGYWHAPVRHLSGEYVRGMAHTNGIESFRSMLKRSCIDTFHKISPKHLPH